MTLKRARQYVLWLLGRRDYSEFALLNKLKSKGLPKDEAQTLLSNLNEEGLFRPENYKRARTRQLIKRGLGPNLVKSKLRQEKCEVSDSEIENLLDEQNSSIAQELKEAIKRTQVRLEKRKNLKPEDFQKKLIQYLMSKGHAYFEIKKALINDPQS
jgi:regulatory protein